MHIIYISTSAGFMIHQATCRSWLLSLNLLRWFLLGFGVIYEQLIFLCGLFHIFGTYFEKRIGTKDFNSRKGAWTVDEKMSLPDAWPSGVFGWGYSYGTPWCHRCPFPWAWCDQFAVEVMTRRRKLPAIMLVMGWPCNYEYCIMNDCGIYIWLYMCLSKLMEVEIP